MPGPERPENRMSRRDSGRFWQAFSEHARHRFRMSSHSPRGGIRRSRLSGSIRHPYRNDGRPANKRPNQQRHHRHQPARGRHLCLSRHAPRNRGPRHRGNRHPYRQVSRRLASRLRRNRSKNYEPPSRHLPYNRRQVCRSPRSPSTQVGPPPFRQSRRRRQVHRKHRRPPCRRPQQPSKCHNPSHVRLTSRTLSAQSQPPNTSRSWTPSLYRYSHTTRAKHRIERLSTSIRRRGVLHHRKRRQIQSRVTRRKLRTLSQRKQSRRSVHPWSECRRSSNRSASTALVSDPARARRTCWLVAV